MPVSSNTANIQPAKTSTGVEAAANAETAKVIPIAQEDAGKPHLLAASYYSLQDNMKATLTLNNKAPRQLDVQPTLFSLAGERLDVPPVTVEANSFRVVDISELVVGTAPIFEQGSLQLFYRGMDLMLGAQVKLVDSDHSLIFDEQLVEPAAMFSSSRLEGVWWLPSKRCEMSLVLSNTTDSPLLVNTVVDGAAPKRKVPATFALTPHETRIIDVQRDVIGKPGGGLMEVGGISIEHSGPNGALLARGMIKDASSGYSAAVQFADSQGAKSSRLHGAGLRLGAVAGERLSPVVVARNIGSTATVLTGQVSYTEGSGSADNAKVARVHLQPGEARIVRTPVVGRDVASAGLEFEYSTAPGTVIMSAISVSRDGDQVFRVPLLDPAAQQSSTGGYPWLIEETSSTVVYVKNVTDKPQEYVLELNYSGGVYTLGIERLEAGQTAAVDIRKLRDNQVADENGQVIPKDATGGQVHWSVRGPEDLVLIGRAEQVDAAKGVSSSFACQNCCGDSFAGVTMHRIRRLVLFCTVSCLVTITFGQSGRPASSARDEAILERRVAITIPGQESTIGFAFMHVMVHAQAPGGIVTVSSCSEEPKFKFDENRRSLREALDAIAYSDPTNRWESKDGVVNLIPVSNMPALLELRIAEFQVENAKTVLDALNHLLNLPEVRQRIAQLHLEELSREPGLTDLKRPGSIAPDPPGLNVYCKKTTLRGALNAIARAHGSAVWSYAERHCSGGRDEFRIDFIVR